MSVVLGTGSPNAGRGSDKDHQQNDPSDNQQGSCTRAFSPWLLARFRRRLLAGGQGHARHACRAWMVRQSEVDRLASKRSIAAGRRCGARLTSNSQSGSNCHASRKRLHVSLPPFKMLSKRKVDAHNVTESIVRAVRHVRARTLAM